MEEISKRVAVLKRFRDLLLKQRQRFQHYINLLDKQKETIEGGSAEDLVAHVELAEKINADILSLHKAIGPIHTLYTAVRGNTDDDKEIQDLNATLENLKVETSRRAERNKNLLQNRMVMIRNELKTLRNSPASKRKSIYAENNGAALIDIKG
jgi:hypothetical protein